jgi:hypothetical protein
MQAMMQRNDHHTKGHISALLQQQQRTVLQCVFTGTSMTDHQKVAVLLHGRLHSSATTTAV